VNFENKMLRTVVEKLKLRRMRFKVDPAISNLEDFKGDTSYEGYVLNENEGVMTILVIDPKTGVRQTMAATDSIDVLSNNLNMFKKSLVQTILNKVPEQVLVQIQNASTYDEVEQLAKQNGATDDDIKTAYRKQTNESLTVNEQGPISKMASGIAKKAKDAVKGSGALRQTVGKASDIAQDVAFGKDSKGFFGKLGGLIKAPGRIGKTLSKIAKGEKIDFTQRSGVYHKDKPRMGQTFQMRLGKSLVKGTVAGEKRVGGENYIELKNVFMAPVIPQYGKVGSILVDFDLNSEAANFYVYNTQKKMVDSFSGNIGYDPKNKQWRVQNINQDTVQVKQGKSVKQKTSQTQAKTGSKKYTSSQKNIKALAQKEGWDAVQEPYGQKRLLFKSKRSGIYFDSNFNKQTPKLRP